LPKFFTKNSDETKLTKLSTIAKQLLAFDQPLAQGVMSQRAIMSQCEIAKDRSSVRLSHAQTVQGIETLFVRAMFLAS